MLRPSRVAPLSIAVAFVWLTLAASACITTVEVQGTGDGGLFTTTTGAHDASRATDDASGDTDGSSSTGTGTGGGDDDAASTASGGDDASTSGDDDDAAPIGKMYMGQATTYTANGASACGPTLSDSELVAAESSDVYSRGECGKCAHVIGPNGSVTVKVEDLCPGCHDESLDLSSTAFSQIADLSAGRVSITWYYVACE